MGWKPISDPVKDRIDYPHAEDLLKDFTIAFQNSSGAQMIKLFTEEAIIEWDPFKEEPLIGEEGVYSIMNKQADIYESVEFTVERFWVVTSTVLFSYHATLIRHGELAHPIRVHGFMSFEMHENLIARLRHWSQARTNGQVWNWFRK